MQRNKLEKLKELFPPYDFRDRIETLVLNELDENTRFYLKNYGIYNMKLQPDRFMLRIRIPGGRISLGKLRFITEVAERYGLELIVTARAQLELHGLCVKSVLKVWELLEKQEICTLQTLTDNFRNIVTDPYDGAAIGSRIEVQPLIARMQDLFLNRPEWMGMLPRKFNTAICGTEESDAVFFSNDIFFGLARRQSEWGFNLYLGGKNSVVASSSGLFVRSEEVPMMFEAVARAYKKYGLRGSRSRTRLYHLLEEVGMKKFVAYLSEFYPQKVLEAGEFSIRRCVPSHFRKLKDGTFGYCYQSRYGILDTHALKIVLDHAQKEGWEVRIGVDQNLHFLGLKEKLFPFEKTVGASQVTACAGSRYCALSLWDIKSDVSYLPLENIEKYNIQIGFSGCLKGCGRHHHTDIGLVGLRTNSYGQTQKAARIFLGGIYSRSGSPARLIFPVVPLKYLRSVLDVVIEEYLLSEEKDFEAFSLKYLNPLSEGFLLLWFLSKLYLKEKIRFEPLLEEVLYQRLLHLPDFPSFEKDEGYVKSIDLMKHALWDDVPATRIS